MKEILSISEVNLLIVVLFFAIVLIDILLAVDKNKKNTITQVIRARAKEEKFWVPMFITFLLIWLLLHFFGDFVLAGSWDIIRGMLAGVVAAIVFAIGLPF